MKVKVFCENTAKKTEEQIQYFLDENKNKIEIIYTNQSNTERFITFTIIYNEKQII